MTTKKVLIVILQLLCCTLAALIAVPTLLLERAARVVGVRAPERWMDRIGSAVSWLVDGWRW
jgi:hypothetical protein